jgi:hypothetical protein
MAYLLSLLWDGSASGVMLLKFLWCALGSLVVALFFIALRRPFGFRVAFLAGLGAAASTGLMVLSTSLNNETPYLVLVMASFCLHERLRERPVSWALGAWSVLHGLACLVRVEHVLFYILLLGYFAVVWSRGARAPALQLWRRSLAATCVSILCFFMPTLPWQIQAMRHTRTFNAVLRPGDDAMSPEARRAEDWIREMTWQPRAQEERQKLPGFARRLASDFVAATVRRRGATDVSAEDFQILEQAFGYRPEPLRPTFFITSYGPLNFYLGNHPLATGGFNRFGLDLPPPLEGGASRYYEHLLLEPPSSGTFYFDWPPHLWAFNHGYAKGWEWIRGHPSQYAGLLLKKLRIFWSGATLGFTGYNLPMGMSGIRRSVDLVVPRESPPVGAWRVAALFVCIAGVAASWRRGPLYPWFLFLLSKVVVVVLFFGYARVGATVAPVVLLLGALALEAYALPYVPPAWRSGRQGRKHRITVAALAIGLAVTLEAARFATSPTIAIDGQIAGGTDPFPPPLQIDQEISVR